MPRPASTPAMPTPSYPGSLPPSSLGSFPPSPETAGDELGDDCVRDARAQCVALWTRDSFVGIPELYWQDPDQADLNVENCYHRRMQRCLNYGSVPSPVSAPKPNIPGLQPLPVPGLVSGQPFMQLPYLARPELQVQPQLGTPSVPPTLVPLADLQTLPPLTVTSTLPRTFNYDGNDYTVDIPIFGVVEDDPTDGPSDPAHPVDPTSPDVVPDVVNWGAKDCSDSDHECQIRKTCHGCYADESLEECPTCVEFLDCDPDAMACTLPLACTLCAIVDVDKPQLCSMLSGAC